MADDIPNTNDVESAEVVLPGGELTDTLAFFTDGLGFRVDSIYPADAPRVAVISGYGIRLRLDADFQGAPGALRLQCRTAEKSESQVAPNGTSIEFASGDKPVEIPPLHASLIVQHLSDGPGWGEGRAGMQYRDLIPDRCGGRFIASHIRIPDGGPVADYVHHHHVHFQMIFCVRGWVRVVYEDQGPPMLMEPGDCFLQPPHIRHRVLESSDNMEVVEISCPAEHETCVDHLMELPTRVPGPDRDFGGQRFVFHQSGSVPWSSWENSGFEQQDTGIENATAGVVSAIVIRASGAVGSVTLRHDGDICFLFVLAGSASLNCSAGGNHRIEKNSSAAIPSGQNAELTSASPDFKMLRVFVPSQRSGQSTR